MYESNAQKIVFEDVVFDEFRRTFKGSIKMVPSEESHNPSAARTFEYEMTFNGHFNTIT